MNLTVSDVNDGIGGYFLDDGTYLQELSSEVYLEGALPMSKLSNMLLF